MILFFTIMNKLKINFFLSLPYFKFYFTIEKHIGISLWSD